MSETKNQDTNEKSATATTDAVAVVALKELTAADAAKLVRREVVIPPEKEGGKPTSKKVAIEPGEILAFKDYGDHVVVVTKDGQKFYGDKKAA